MKKIHVIHHTDLDGFISGLVFYLKYPEANFYMLNYSDPIPNIPYGGFEKIKKISGGYELVADKIFIVDLSYSREQLEAWNNKFIVQLLDHHKSAQETLGDLRYCYFDTSKCGARLAWEWCFPHQKAPWYVNYTEDLDLYKWDLYASKEITTAMYSYKFDFRVWENIITRPLEDFIEEGKVITEYRVNLVHDHVQKAEIKEFFGYKVPVVYCDYKPIISELGNNLCNYYYREYPFAVIWSLDGGMIHYSLRSIGNEMDVSTIAKQNGGGGHKNAAGFAKPFTGKL